MRIDAGSVRRRAPSLTPLIDVVFILLVFFMLVTRLVDWGRLDLEVTTIGAAAGSGDSRVERIVVEPGGLTWRGERFADAAAVAAAAAEAQRAGELEGVLIDAAPAVRLQRLVRVLEALQAAGVSRASLLDRAAEGG
jgi:biopolymer transport protein ExbD